MSFIMSAIGMAVMVVGFIFAYRSLRNDLNAVKTEVATKASQQDLQKVDGRVTEVGTAVTDLTGVLGKEVVNRSKAIQELDQRLNQELVTKAEASAVSKLAASLKGKATKIELERAKDHILAAINCDDADEPAKLPTQ